MKKGNLFAALALRHDGRMKPFTEFIGQLINLMGTINLNRPAGGIEHHLAMLAIMQMGFNLRAHLRGHRAVELELLQQLIDLAAFRRLFGLLFRRNSVSGAVEVIARSGTWGSLSADLHGNQ